MSESVTFQHDPEGLVLKYIDDPRPDTADLVMIQYAGLVERVARKFAGIEPQEDLVQVGFIGLLNALSKFDAKAGVRFHTYATHLIAGEIKHYLRDRSQMIRLPAWLQELRARVNKAAGQLQADLGRVPTPREVADALQMSESAVVDVWQSQELLKVGSLDQPMGDDESSDADEIDAAEFCPAQMSVEDRVVLEDAMGQLRELEHQVLVLFHFESLNQTEIANRLGISCNYVSHILRQSLNKLRRILVREDESDRTLRLELGGEDKEIVDAQTGAFTEEFFFSRLTEEAHRAKSSEGVVSVMLVRFDGLDQLGSLYGPSAISDFMVDAAEHLKDNVRRLDIVCRHGNVGFGIILPSTGPAVNIIAARLHELMTKFLATRLAPVGSLSFALESVAFPDQVLTVQNFVAFAKDRTPNVEFSTAARAGRRSSRRAA